MLNFRYHRGRPYQVITLMRVAVSSQKQPILNGRYRVERKLGKGAMGNVFLAIDMQEDEPVAIKTISQDLYQNDEIRERFNREVAALRRLNHPNIIGYVDTFAVSGRACLVMEYVGGGTLADVIRDRQQLDHGFFKNIAMKMIQALHTAHMAGIIHRDLKPANVFMNAVLEPKLGDFGLAKVNDFSSLTMTGTTMGTLAYMAPEAFDAIGQTDHRADIWALGVIFYEMLTGTLPFPTESQPRLIGAILREKPSPMESYRRDIPVSWQLMIETCLEKNPTDRYQSAIDMIDDLNEVPRARQQFKEVNPLEGAFGLRFMEEDLDVILTSGTKDKTIIIEDSALHHASARKYTRESKRSAPAILLLISGLLIWVGIMAAILGGGSVVYAYFVPESDFANSIDNARLLALIGSILFMGALIIEATAIRPQRALELVVLMFGVAMIWLVFFSGIILTSYLGAALGTVFYIMALTMYFQTQRT